MDEGTYRELDATAEIFCLAFDRLNKKEKQKVIERLMEMPSIREDLIDLALIEASRKEKGEDIRLDDYIAMRKNS